MVKSPKTGRELEPAWHVRGPEWARKFFQFFGIKGLDAEDDTE